MRKLVFFDLDGTIISSPSSEKVFLWNLLARRYIKYEQCKNSIEFVFNWISEYKQYVFIKDKSYLAGLSLEFVTALANEIAKDKLLPKIRPMLKSIIDMHRDDNHTNILITGAHQFIAEIFAKHLGIDEVYATKCEMKDGVFINAPALQHPFRESKLVIAEQICNKYGVSISDCVAYGDSINDRFLLEKVGRPVAVSPDFRLKRMALKKGWEVLY